MSWLKRILLNSILFLSILFLPWWVSVLFILIYIWKYDLPEVIVYALLMDILYVSVEATRSTGYILPFGFKLPPLLLFTFGTAFAMYILNFIKNRIRF